MKGSSIVTGIAWLLYGASWFIQWHREGTTLIQGGLPGWEAFLVATVWVPDLEWPLVFKVISVSSALTNLLMIASPVIVLGRFERLKSALPWLFILATIVDAQWFVFLLEGERRDLRAGYYLWCASFLMLAVARFLNQRASRAALPRWFER